MHAWYVGIWAILISGIFKLCCAYGSTFVRKSIPRAGLLGSLAAVAAVLIGFCRCSIFYIIHWWA